MPADSHILDDLCGVTAEQTVPSIKNIMGNYYSDVRYVKEIDSYVFVHNTKKNIAVLVERDVDFNDGFISLVFDGRVLTLDINAAGNVSDIFVEGKSVGDDIDSLIGALEVLAGE